MHAFIVIFTCLLVLKFHLEMNGFNCYPIEEYCIHLELVRDYMQIVHSKVLQKYSGNGGL